LIELKRERRREHMIKEALKNERRRRKWLVYIV